MNINNNLSIRTIIYIISKILLQGIGVVSNFILVRLLSTEDFGIVSVFTAWVSILSIVVGLRIDGTINNGRIEFKDKFENYCSSTLFLSSIWFVILLIIVMIASYVFRNVISTPIWIILFAFLNSFGTFVVSVRTVYYSAKKKPIGNLVVSAINSITTLVVSVVLILYLGSNKYIGRIIGLSVPSFFMGVIIIIMIFNRGKTFYDKGYWKFALSLSLPLIVSGLSSVILSQFDRIMINKMIDTSHAGIYSFAYTIALPIYVLLTAFAEGWSPEYFDLLSQNKLNEIQKHMYKYAGSFVALTCGYMLISPEVLRILGTNDYYQGQTTVFIIVFLYFVYFLQSWPVNYEFFHKKTNYVAYGFILSAIINIILNYCFIIKWNIAGAAYATLISSFFLFLFHEYNARYKMEDYHVNPTFYLFTTLPVGVIFLFCEFFSNCILLRWLVATGFGIFLICKVIKDKAII